MRHSIRIVVQWNQAYKYNCILPVAFGIFPRSCICHICVLFNLFLVTYKECKYKKCFSIRRWWTLILLLTCCARKWWRTCASIRASKRITLTTIATWIRIAKISLKKIVLKNSSWSKIFLFWTRFNLFSVLC